MRVWRVAVPLVAACAGLLFTTSAVASHGVDLRNDRVRVTDLIDREQQRAADAQAQYVALQAQMDADGASVAAGDASAGHAGPSQTCTMCTRVPSPARWNVHSTSMPRVTPPMCV